MYEEQFFISRGCPLEDAVTLAHTARRDGTLEEIMNIVNECFEANRKCGCNPPCKHCTCNQKGCR